jgi:sterol desaturase/sphingolipid hydroxylase (fatty acid hydroxylase superfamily)
VEFVDFFNIKGLIVIALIFIPIEHLLPLHAEQRVFRQGWLTDLAHYFLSGIVIKLGLAIVIISTMSAGALLVAAEFREWVAELPLWLQVISILLIADLGFYVAHRLFHSVPWLWRFHAVHHSIEEMDWLAAHRVHPFDQIVTKSFSLIPVFVLGFSEAALGIFALLYHWQSLLIHSNVRIKFGPLRWLLATPEFHHWHHANQAEAYDKNFSGQLPLWDVIFGTVHMPKGQMPKKYGVDEPVPRTYLKQFLYPFQRNQDQDAVDQRQAATTAKSEVDEAISSLPSKPRERAPLGGPTLKLDETR